MNKDLMKKLAEDLYEQYKSKMKKCADECYNVSKNALRYLVNEFAAELNGILSDNDLWEKSIYNWFRSADSREFITVEEQYIRECDETMKHLTRKLNLSNSWEKLLDILNHFYSVISGVEEVEEKEDRYSDCDYTDTITVKVIRNYDNGDYVIAESEKGERYAFYKGDLDYKAGDKLKVAVYEKIPYNLICEIEVIEQKKDRLTDLLENISKYVEAYTEAVKNGKDDIMEEDIRYMDTDSVKEVDDTEAEILRQGKLPWESDYGTEEKYYLIAHPMSVARAYMYGADLIAPYEIRKEKLSFNEESLGSYLVYKGSYEECLKEFHSRAEYISERVDEKIHFKCIGVKEFKGRGEQDDKDRTYAIS